MNRGLTEAWIAGAVRTPIGRHGGALSSVRPDDLGAIALKEQDRFALGSHKKAICAQQEKRFHDELAKLKAAFKEGGTVTAGNSSTLNDGAAAVLVVSKEYAKAHGLKPLARIKSVAVAGVPPRVMGIGPAPATKKALERAGISLDEVGLIELNEAFAAQVLAVLYEWGMDPEDGRLNPNGGAIALGHPLGASGARLGRASPWSWRRSSEVRSA